MSTITFTCPHCSFSKQLPASAEGQQGNCPSCNAVVTITTEAPVIPSVSAQQPLQQIILGNSTTQLRERAGKETEPSKDKADDMLEYYAARAGNYVLYETTVDQSNRTIPHICGLFLMLLGLVLCLSSTYFLISAMSGIPILKSPREDSEFTGPDVPVPHEEHYISAILPDTTLIWIGLAGWISLFIAHRFLLDKSRVGNFTTRLLLLMSAMPLFGFLFINGYLGPLTCPICALLALVAFWAAGGQRFK